MSHPRIKLSFEYVYNYFIEYNCELLETEYTNNKMKLKYKCKCNNISYTTFKDFKSSNSKLCMECCGSKKYTFEYVYKYFKNNGCKLLETEYKNNNTKLNYICKNNHNVITTFNRFNRGERCLSCSGYEKYTYEFVKNEFTSNGCELLSTKYKHNKDNLQFICKNKHISYILFKNFLKNTNTCGKCKNKTEQMILEYLENNYNNIIFQPSFDWCKNKNNLPFDFLLNNFKIILEIDGRQHFSQVSNWKSPEFNLQNDIYKSNLAINNGYKIIRIFQEDVFNNKFNWQELLNKSIEILNNTDEYIIYLSTDNNLYNKHKFELTKKILENKLNNLKI